MSSIISSEGGYTVGKVPAGEVKIAIQCLSLQPKTGGGSPGRRMAEQAVKSGKLDPEKVPPAMKKKLNLSGAASEQAVALPTHYADPETSGLTCTVLGGAQTHDIDLK